MILLGQLVFVIELILVIYCVLSVLTTPADQIKHLPKLVWLVLVILLPLLGGISWLLFGRAAGARTPRGPAGTGLPPRPGRARRAPAPPPDDDEDFLRSLRERAEEQRRQAERERRRREQDTPPET